MAGESNTPHNFQREATVRDDLPAASTSGTPGPDQRGDMTIREAEIPRYTVQERGASPEPHTSKDLISLLSVSGLRTPSEVNVLVSNLTPDDFKISVDLLAGKLVEKGQLTDYQVRKLLSGDAYSLVFKDYAIETKLGEGGIAKVFLARWRKTGQMVALKVVPPNDPRFDREVRAVAKLSHPNVVAVLDRGAGPAGDYLAMEWVEGPDLAGYLDEKKKLPVGEAMGLMLQAARGVAHLHEHRIIHRDLKPQNFVLAPDGTLKLIDLGLARFDLRPSSFSQESDNLTAEGSTLGTPSYMAPEQIKNASTADYRSDIYSLGCMLYHLLTGGRPYAKFNPMDAMQAQLMEPTPSLSAACPGVPAKVEALYERMMAKDPKKRPQTMEDLIADLEALQTEVPTAGAASVAAPPAGGFPILLVIGAVILAAVAAAGIWFATR